jgi:hypothetical protein
MDISKGVTYQNGQNQGVVQGKQTLAQHQVHHDQQARACKKKREFLPGEKPQKIVIKTFEKFHDRILSTEIELLFLSAYAMTRKIIPPVCFFKAA